MTNLNTSKSYVNIFLSCFEILSLILNHFLLLQELQMVGENMKSLETSAEETEEKLKERILSIQRKYKAAEGRFEYGEMSITKMNQ